MHTVSWLSLWATVVSTVVAEQLVIPEYASLAKSIVASASAHIKATKPTDTVLPAPHSPGVGVTPEASAPYWYEEIDHQGISAFGPSGFAVYRNVMDYGAKGDGVTDDTAAINAAISADGTCGRGCTSSTTTPNVVYFPAGTYMISSPINPAYMTQMIGNPNSVPTIKALASFPNSNGFALIDADPYYTSSENWHSTNVFYRQIRNFIIDTTNIPAGTAINALHWPTAQATSLQDVTFQLSSASGTQHVGIFIEDGSGGFMSDVTINGGLVGAKFGNQQFTMRGLTFNNCVTAISHFWSWGWTYINLAINNCGTGIDISAGGSDAQAVGSIIVIDSTVSSTSVAFKTAYDQTSSTGYTNGTMMLENVSINNVGTAVEGPSGTLLGGGSTTISAWGQGHQYTPQGPSNFQGSFSANQRSSSLLSGSNYYQQSKPQFASLSTSQVVSVRSQGATGNGVTDDTAAVQKALNTAAANGYLCFFDAGTYLVTSTITIPAGSKVTGEAYSVIMSSGSFFNNINSPQPVVQIGSSNGQSGSIQWTDMIVSTQGNQEGAILIQWNLAASSGSGIWDVHTRIGGFTGSDLQASQCPTSSTNCLAAYMSMHVTSGASNVYLENMWLWTADHDMDSSDNTQISIYTGRGLLIESTAGTIWMVGTAVEHHSLYQYQLSGTQNVFMGQIQTETPYYQPGGNDISAYPPNSNINDPTFNSCSTAQCKMAWGLRILSSSNIFAYGADHYSFFNSYSTACSTAGVDDCQTTIVDLEGSLSNLNIYCLNTVGVQEMVSSSGSLGVNFEQNRNVYPNLVALYR